MIAVALLAIGLSIMIGTWGYDLPAEASGNNKEVPVYVLQQGE
ncbi:MAG: hypothetical protein ACLRXQ_08740 [Phascolarctobacterium faecium]